MLCKKYTYRADRSPADVYCTVHLALNKIKYEFSAPSVSTTAAKSPENEKDFADTDVLGEIEPKKKGNLCVKNIIH